jgi:hypothetical protein
MTSHDIKSYCKTLQNIVRIAAIAVISCSVASCMDSDHQSTQQNNDYNSSLTSTPATPNENSEWQMYSDDDVTLQFQYPQDWEVKERDFYSTAGGAVSTHPTLILGSIQSESLRENTIWINMRQATCMSANILEEYQNITLEGQMPQNDSEGCVEAWIGDYHLVSFFDDPEIVPIFKKVLTTLQTGNKK